MCTPQIKDKEWIIKESVLDKYLNRLADAEWELEQLTKKSVVSIKHLSKVLIFSVCVNIFLIAYISYKL